MCWSDSRETAVSGSRTSLAKTGSTWFDLDDLVAVQQDDIDDIAEWMSRLSGLVWDDALLALLRQRVAARRGRPRRPFT